MTSWQRLDSELEAWAAVGKRATLWWRDDDAAEDCPALERLLTLAEAEAAPLVIAAIPAALREAAVARINASQAPGLAVVQHGYAHTNHAREGEKKIELGGANPAPQCIAHLHMGHEILSGRFPKRFLPTLVPPWNRIDPALLGQLPALGYTAISIYGARQSAEPEAGLKQINCHIDILNWRQDAVFLDEAEVLKLACNHLEARRNNQVDVDEPTGLLSHHLRHDEAAWRFLEKFVGRTAVHPAAQWLRPTTLFA